MERKTLRLYNVLFPVWMLIWFPTWLWLLLIPGNYLIDRLVLRWSLAGREDRDLFCRRHTWKICLAGFLSDFVGAALLFAVSAGDGYSEMSDAVAYNPFGHWGAFFVVLGAVILSGLLIFLLDRLLLKKAGLDPAQARKSAMPLAMITAPYLFFFPSGLLYR